MMSNALKQNLHVLNLSICPDAVSCHCHCQLETGVLTSLVLDGIQFKQGVLAFMKINISLANIYVSIILLSACLSVTIGRECLCKYIHSSTLNVQCKILHRINESARTF